MHKLDPPGPWPDLYRPPLGRPILVDVPRLAFLMTDGGGDPNTSPRYAQAVEALYAVSYGVKFAVKNGPDPIDFKVMPLEGFWWSEDMTAFANGRRDSWTWTMMIAQPHVVTEGVVETAVAAAGRKKDLPALGDVRFEALEEGRCAQILHVGPYSAEGPTIERLHDFIAEHGYGKRGKHHEIYVGDPRRTAPERLRTVIRQPVGP